MISFPVGLQTEHQPDNVLIFISDSLRYDTLPESIQSLGVTTKAIAPAPWTASSVPSLMTGLYPSTHSVWMFEDRLPERPPLLSQPGDWTAGIDSEKHWLQFESSKKPPIRMLQLDGEQRFSEVEEPFVHVVHDLGPHAPYGFENDEYRTGDYFEEYSDPEQLKQLYTKDAEKSAQYFIDIIEKLKKRNLLDNTLCVFTSDHGELLGERGRLGGKWGHSTPLCPELLEIPMVFVGTGLPEGEALEGLVSGVDLAPTCLSAVGRDTGRVDGIDLWTETPDDDRQVRADVWQRYNALGREWPVYVASSVWDNSGGWVKHRRSALLRAAYYGYDVFVGDYSPASRQSVGIGDIISGMNLWRKTWAKFGSPDITKAEAGDLLDYELTRSAESVQMTNDQKDQLEALGYV